MSEQSPPPATPQAAEPAAAPAANPAEAQAPADQAPDGASLRNSFASAAANSPNKTSGHLGYQQSAQRQLLGGSLHDAVMGDKNVNNFYYGAADRATLTYRKLSPEAVDEALAFVEPPQYPRVSRFAAGRALVVLTGPAGSGRAATAVHLLAAGTGRQSIHLIHNLADFAALTPQSLPNGTGIVLPDVTDRAAASLDDFTLRRLVDGLAAAGQKLIITAPDTLVWHCAEIATHTVALGPRPEPVAVAAAKFRRRFGPSGQATATALLDRPDVRDLIARRLGPDRPLADADRLATLLADSAADPEAMAANAETGMAAGVAGETEAWFDRLADDPRDQFYAIALAVLNGLAKEKVADAAKRLERLLAPETAEARDERRRPTFGGSNRARLARVHALQAPGTDPGVRGEAQGQIVRYINRDFPRRLLTHVWEQYDDERGALTRWLRDLGDSPFEDIHIGAGVAAGVLLAMSSYDHVLQTIVLPWAWSRKQNQQDAAAVALQTLGSDPRFAPRVKPLLHEWADPDPDSDVAVSLQATAARAYGADFGAQRIEEAIELLTRLAAVEQWPVAEAVSRSLAELIATETPGVTARVFTLFGEWVSGRKQYLRSMGRLAFLYAAADLVTQRSVQGANVKWPAFLHLDQDPQYTAVIRYLWADALNASDLHQTAREVLSAWAKSLDGDPRGCQALARMLAGIAGTDRTKAIVRRLTQEWTGRDGAGPAPRAAAALAPMSIR